MFIRTVRFIFITQFFILFLLRGVNAFTIEDAVNLALTNNLTLKTWQMNQKLSESDLSEKKSQNFGKIDIISSYTHYNLPRTLVPMTPASLGGGASEISTTEDLFVTGIMYEVPLFTGFAQKRLIETSELQQEIAKSVTKLSREKLIYNVRTIYVNILALNAQKEAQVSYSAALQGFHDVISQEVKLGKRARVEQLKAAAEVEKSKAALIRLSGNIRIVKASLAILLNIEEIPLLQKIEIEIIRQRGEDPLYEIKELEQYRAKQLDVEKNEKLVKLTNATLYPQIVLNAFYGQNFGPNDSSNSKDGDWENKEVWQTSLNLKWNIFDFGGKTSKIQKAKIRKHQSLLEKRNASLEIKKNMIKANAEIETATVSYYSAKAELAMTEEMEIIEQVRFDKGAISINDLLYAKARNQQSLSRFISAGYSCLNAQFYLDYMLENGDGI